VLKRTGYFDAAAKPKRVFRDDQHLLDVEISFVLGSLYHFGQVRIQGLTPELEAKARSMWRLQAGDPYDYAYPLDFIREFSRSVDLRNLKNFESKAQPGTGPHVMDFTLVFVFK
jgi:outer membrane translocation and assembly module TamA